MYRVSHFCHVLLLLTLSENDCVQCACKGSIVVFCESINDLEYEPSQKKISWKELIVGDTKDVPKHTAEAVMHFPEYGDNVEKITIINQLDVDVLNFNNVRSSLTSLTFYGNNLKEVIGRTTPYFSKNLDIVSFHNNNIERIVYFRLVSALSEDATSDYFDYINIMDLSYNKINDTGTRFGRAKFLNVLQVNELILSHNNIWLIRPACLPQGLKRLHLDYNEFSYFSWINFNSNNLSQLEFLTVAHNKLHTVDDLPVLDALSHLDLSFNKLHYIHPDVFINCKNLRILSLNHNNLIRFTFPNLNRDLNDVHVIDLSFNRLRYLDVKPVSNFTVEVFLFGNPWNCRCMDVLKNSKLYGNRFVEKRPCEDRFADYIPYCVVNDSYHSDSCTSEPVDDKDFDLFQNVTRITVNKDCRKRP